MQNGSEAQGELTGLILHLENLPAGTLFSGAALTNVVFNAITGGSATINA